MRRQHDTVSTEQQNWNRDNLRESRGCALARPSVVHGHAPLREARLEEFRRESVRGSRARDPLARLCPAIHVHTNHQGRQELGGLVESEGELPPLVAEGGGLSGRSWRENTRSCASGG